MEPEINRSHGRLPTNDELVPGAGSVKLHDARMWGTGIIEDIRTTVGTHWFSEMTNLNQKTIAVTLLMFVSCMAPALAFGAVYSVVTENLIGALETIAATSWVGVVYSLIGGMPLCMIGSTGPVLAFTRALVSIADNLDIPFPSFYAWVSVWILIYAALAAFFDMTRYVRLATRFLDEIFALLIVSIFVLDAVGDPFSTAGILRYFQPDHPFHEDNNDDPDYNWKETALLGTVLGFGTTALIFFFRSFKFSAFFCNQGIRTSIHDFAVTIAVIGATLIKEYLFPDIEMQQLNVPETVEPTYQCCDSSCTSFWPDDCPDVETSAGARPWFADFGDLNGKGWVPFMAAGPAFLGFFLVYLDNGITWHLINHPSHKIQHGEAYNYDLLLSGIFNLINGILGLPWLVATTVPCVVHLNSLAEKDKDGNFLGVQETRLTMLFSHALIGCSLLFLDVLRLLPLPVLFGVFLFMGLSSLPNMQFFHRVCMFFQQPSKYPRTPYTRFIPKQKIHLYTVLQIGFFGLVFLVQNFPAIAVVFPLMTLLCIPGRLYFLPLFFQGWELCLLDGADDEIEEWMAAKEESLRSIHYDGSDEEADEKASKETEKPDAIEEA